MSKILFITPYTPDNQGIGVSYTSQLLKELSKDCDIDLFYFRYKGDKPYYPVNDNINIIKEVTISNLFKINGLINFPFVFPLFSSRFSWSLSREINKKIKSISYDIVYLDFSQTFLYSLMIKHPNIVLMAHDVIFQRYQRMKSVFLPWVKISERILMKNARIIVTFSKKDSQIIKKEYSYGSICTNFFLNSNVINAIPSNDSNYFVFFGSWLRYDNYEALTWFLDNVYDRLSKNIVFKVIGGGLPENIKRKMNHFSNFEYLGFVDNPYPIIANARAEIVPLHYGAGVKVKCIEALGCGIPIIGTEVAFEGISEIYRESMIVANSPSDYVNVINTMQNSIETKKLAKAKFLETYNSKEILQYIRNK